MQYRQYSDGNPPNRGVECTWGRQKSRLWTYACGCCQRWIGQVLSTRRRRTTLSQVVTHIAGSKRRGLFTAGDSDEMFVTRSLNVTPKTTEQHLIARSDKSVAYVTNNKRLCSTFCTVGANYWQTRNIARLLCESRATVNSCDGNDATPATWSSDWGKHITKRHRRCCWSMEKAITWTRKDITLNIC